MIFKSFLLDNPLSLCMKIINSVVVVGLYYGFLTTFSIGPSYLLLLQARVMEEGTEKEVSATTGFLAGQLMMFISIYYAPLHLALGRPHTITVLVIPYLLLNFFWNNQKNFFDDGSTTRNSMRNLSIQCVFLNNLIFQLLNHFILPSSTLARLVNISMFRCNNKILFLTSSFVGWLIGHILFMKWVGLVLFWIRQNHSIRIRSNKYLLSELRNSMARIFSILLFITCVYYLGRMPSPIVTRKMRARETSETEEGGERNEESDVEKTYKMKETKQEQEGFIEENPYLFSEEREDLEKIYETEEIRVNGKEKTKYEFHFKEARYQDSPVYEDSDLETHQENWELGRLKEEKKKIIKKNIYMWVEKICVSFLFDFNRWNRPLRYIKNDNLENALRNEMSQFFFFTCTSDGKQIISFTYPPSLSTFSEILEQIISLYIIEKLYDKDISNFWINTNEKRKCNLNNELKRRIQILEKNEVSSSLDILEKRTILCDDEKKEKCLPKAYDPFFNGPYRGTRKELDSRTIMNIYKDTEDLVEFFFINKIHDLFLNYFVELHCQSFLNFIGEKGIDSENQAKYLQFIFDVITTQTKDKKTLKNKSIGIRIKEVSKKVSRWSYKLTESFIDEEEENEHDEYLEEDEHELYSRGFKRVTVYNDYDDDNDPNADSDYKMAEIFLLRYSKESDFRRNLIKGSMRAQRRKTVIWNFFQGDAHSPLFLDRIDKIYFFFSFDIKKLKNVILSIWMGREQESEFKIGNLEDEDTNEQLRISEVWESYLIPHILRSLILLTHSFIRKYILLPSLIIAKNTFRVLLFQIPEWNKDFQEWKKETHIKCTYNGIQLSENKFPQGWLLNGIQIKILYPFCLKPWRKSKAQSHHKNLMKKKEKKINFYFLTVWGLEAEVPFGPPRKQPSFFKPIYKEIKKETKNMKKIFLQVLKYLNKGIKSFQKIRKEETKGVIKIVQVIKLIMKKVNTIFLFELRKEKAYESNKNKKDFKRNNQIICESSVLNRTINSLDYSLIENRTKGLYDKTIKIRNQIERTTKEKKEIVLNSDKKGSGSQKPIWKILKSKNIRLMRKSYYFIQFFIEKIYIDILLCIITFSKINAQLLFESTKKIFNKSIYNNEIKNKINKEQEGIDKKNQNTMNFLLTIKKLFSNTENTKNSNQDPNNYWDLSFLSQAYVFYKISQNQLINKSLLRSVLQYQGSYPFFKDNFKDYCIMHGIFNYKSTHKKINTYVINEWKNWLKVHYQYALYKKERSRLVPKECQNTINEHRMIQNKQSNQLDLYKKYQFISLMNKNDYEVNSFMSKKDKWKKHYRYDLLTSKYISFPNLYISGSTLERNGDQEITYHSNILKPEYFYVLVSIPSNDYIEKEYLIDSNTNLDRKYFDCRILNLYFIEDIDIEIWTNAHIGIKIQKDTKTEITNFKINNFKRMEKRYLFFPTIDQEIKPSNQKSFFFDWRGMNKERLYDTTSNHYTISNSNLETWFFPEFVLLFDVYQIRPWILPIKSLFFNFSINEESKNININTKKSSTKKRFLEFFLEFFNFKQEENEQQVQENLVWNKKKEKQYKSNNELDLFFQQRELNFFLKKHLIFQLGSTNLLHKQIMDDIRICSLLLRLKKPKDIAIAYLQRDELNLIQMMIQKDLILAEVIKRGIFMIEPILLSIQKGVKSIIYQTMDISMDISLVNNNKHQTKKKNIYIEKTGFEKSIARHSNIFLSGDKNHYDLLVPENILSPRRCREFRIQICFNSRNFDVVDRNPRFCNENKIRNCEQFLNENKHINTDRKNFIKFKLFLWPYYRLEDVACMNRYWFDTNNSSCFSMSRIHMYSQFKMN
uniref:Protein TIC 214 n=1 Tax=Oberonia seidenfadenii TaxID=1921744 RepID=A0A888V9A4_9ASPA|nr:hypothetical protein RF1 [Oberonia seidenfadenii]QRC27131.1 hypothetical protein RF1 [Oberonia seidenfadenii]